MSRRKLAVMAAAVSQAVTASGRGACRRQCGGSRSGNLYMWTNNSMKTRPYATRTAARTTTSATNSNVHITWSSSSPTFGPAYVRSLSASSSSSFQADGIGRGKLSGHGHGHGMPELGRRRVNQTRSLGQGQPARGSSDSTSACVSSSSYTFLSTGCRAVSDIKISGSGRSLKRCASSSSLLFSLPVTNSLNILSSIRQLPSFTLSSPLPALGFSRLYSSVSSISSRLSPSSSGPLSITDPSRHTCASAIGRLRTHSLLLASPYSQPCSSSASFSSSSFAMYRKYAAMGYQASRSAVPMPNSSTPMEDIIRAKITAAFNPTVLEIENQSHLHAHHKAMVGSTSKETHFKLHITSEAFNSKMAPARHRMVYALLGEEMAREGGIHALSLRTTTPDEELKRLAKTEKASSAAVPVAE